MLAENIKSWFVEYEDKGRKEGEVLGLQKGEILGQQRGEALALQRLLSKRFGAISTELVDRIASASVTQIETWLDRVIDARELTDVFDAS